MVLAETPPTESDDLTEPQVIPPRILKTEAHSDPDAWFKIRAYPSHAGIQYVVLLVKAHLGISNRALDMLLGVPREDCGKYTWRWLNGVKRPSALYLSRMLVLQDLKNKGHSLVRWKTVDWDTGKIEMREARGKNGRVHFVAGRNLSDLKGVTRR